ncbi:hypothetical protein CcaverHIS002_0106670 [Cutaneotrichosporon cavernicola]|nr:hypothetical protein CcaverHIS002_0106670 [Cutaneotrichosporon cavernicola]
MSRPPINTNVSFDRGSGPPRPPPKGGNSSKHYENAVPTLGYEESGYASGSYSQGGADVRRKKSMVRPERERIEPGHRLYHYQQHAADQSVRVHPSATGNQPYAPHRGGASGLRRGKSVLGREGDQETNESGLNLFKRGATIRRKASRAAPRPRQVAPSAPPPPPEKPRGLLQQHRSWPQAQRAFREKMGIVAICAGLMAIVGFITFGFTQVVCGNHGLRVKGGQVNNGSVVNNGYVYDLADWKHPAVAGSEFNGTNSPIWMDEWQAGGKDMSFLFQRVNLKCRGLLTPGPAATSDMKGPGDTMAWYFPCRLVAQNMTEPVDKTGAESGTNCHLSVSARQELGKMPADGIVYYTWDQVAVQNRNLAVYKGSVLDFGLLDYLDPNLVKYPSFFNTLKGGNDTFQGRDVTSVFVRASWEPYGDCLTDIIRVGFVDSMTIGCVASQIVLYVSLVFILGAVMIKFFMALYFGWFMSWRIGNFEGESYKDRMKRAEEIENWTDDIYRAAPGYMRPNARDGSPRPGKKGHFLPKQSRFSKADTMMVSNSRPNTSYGSPFDTPRRQPSSFYGNKLTPPGSPMLHGSRSSTSLQFRAEGSRASLQEVCPFPLVNVIPQPAPDFEPFGYPLVHTICLVTAYSESIDGLRTTMDSLATTDYPNSHKFILVVCDGMVRGSGSKQYTPDIVLSMMKDLVVPENEVEAHSYVAIADGHKRHNMAKVYAGFYAYDNDTVEPSKQQRVPIVLVAKTGNPLERNDAKPGNRGKRDSQIVLMDFLQKVMFDERMTTFQYEFFNAIWRCTGVSPDKYETVLCVDADTKVYPDSVSRMNACMVNDTEIMGLCGETKIANKRETWVTMIQVFEYYISHHLTKAFESVFGGVTCLPGCFSMYRIKAPKGATGYWVPVLNNPDIVEHYSENIVDTLHKKNLLLLGEDRYLSTLLLKTFPKRKMVWCPQAVCKTIVPDTFKILLSQRRRWINSTIHNLFELMLVRDLCGTFCFSMQFVVFMDLVGTLVLPAAITFTLYVAALAIRSAIEPEKQQTPTVSLILLAFILGLPGLLIVITSRKMVYVGWMCMYLLSLPVWNFVLPAYSFWHMDDFSWGETRKVAGETKEEVGHGDKDGEFDSSDIVLKRWAEFERERRWREGTPSHDSEYGAALRSNSPGNSRINHRHSMVSTSETYQSGFNTAESQGMLRADAQGYLHGGQYVASPVAGEDRDMASLGLPRHGEPSIISSESGYSGGRPSRSPVDNRSASYGVGYSEEEQPMLSGGMSQDHRGGVSEEHDTYRPSRSQAAPQRGVSLVDPGVAPVSAADPVRRVARQHKRHSSGRGVTSPVSSSSHQSNLPPGAAPARY